MTIKVKNKMSSFFSIESSAQLILYGSQSRILFTEPMGFSLKNTEK
jgi:hypothetical protein